ncbi:MAG: hypothetical protein NT040_01100 [Bacteroidetes bacterium]|nr:hypothetical protein [Bacteroidota bacterium]
MTILFDHDVFDGAPMARFIRDFSKTLIPGQGCNWFFYSPRFGYAGGPGQDRRTVVMWSGLSILYQTMQTSTYAEVLKIQ